MRGKGCRVDHPRFPWPAPAVMLRVTVQALGPKPAKRNTHTVVFAGHGRKVAYHEHKIVRSTPLAQEADHAVISVVAIDPFEALGREVKFEQRWLSAIKRIQVANPALDTSVQGVLQDMPFQTFVMLPLALLTELGAHE